MIQRKTGNILHQEVEALVNTVNCVGVMGRGVALQFKRAFPENFAAYAAACKAGQVRPGRMFLFETSRLTGPRYIVNFPTKRHWRGRSRIEDIESGLKDLVDTIRDRDIRSIAIPPLGSGLGGLGWDEVSKRLTDALSGLEDVEVVVFEPTEGAPAKLPNMKMPRMTPGRAALIGLMHRYVAGLLDPFVTLLELHKLMYFMQAAGEPLELRYNKGHYGPYAENLRHVLNEIEGHFVAGYEDGGDAPHKQLDVVDGAYEEAERMLQDRPQTLLHFQRVSQLVEGFESPFGLELLASVHWIQAADPELTHDQVVAALHRWNPAKRKFSERQVAIAERVLGEYGWVDRGPTA